MHHVQRSIFQKSRLNVPTVTTLITSGSILTLYTTMIQHEINTAENTSLQYNYFVKIIISLILSTTGTDKIPMMTFEEIQTGTRLLFLFQ